MGKDMRRSQPLITLCMHDAADSIVQKRGIVKTAARFALHKTKYGCKANRLVSSSGPDASGKHEDQATQMCRLDSEAARRSESMRSRHSCKMSALGKEFPLQAGLQTT